MAFEAQASHVGSALSCADILWAIYTRAANITRRNLKSLDRDKVVLSKGHASAALYAVLAELKLINPKLLDKYYIDGGVLPGHLDYMVSPAIDATAGSLGHGASIGVGMALANPDRKVFVVMGDGETNEGSVWEAALFAGTHNLSNLIFIIDENELMIYGDSKSIMDNTNIAARFHSCRFEAFEVYGHDIETLAKALNKPSMKPKAIIAHTLKGKDVSFMENKAEWHGRKPTREEYLKAVKEIDNA